MVLDHLQQESFRIGERLWRDSIISDSDFRDAKFSKIIFFDFQ